MEPASASGRDTINRPPLSLIETLEEGTIDEIPTAEQLTDRFLAGIDHLPLAEQIVQLRLRAAEVYAALGSAVVPRGPKRGFIGSVRFGVRF